MINNQIEQTREAITRLVRNLSILPERQSGRTRKILGQPLAEAERTLLAEIERLSKEINPTESVGKARAALG